jgi:predicted AlkP superfamily phosphohydrolase/phosphomutase
MAPTVVVGLDGSNWSLIEPWIENGTLPNFKALRDGGSHGVSTSHLPPVTCPNWKCYASGKNPGKLGVYWWERIDTAARSMVLPDAEDFRSPEIWDYLNRAGRSTGVINLPMSYPPREIDGFMIAGGPRSREKNHTYPDQLEQELQDRFDYRVHPENVLTSHQAPDREIEQVHALLRTRLQVTRELLEKRDIDFLHVTLFHLNVLQHYFWDAEPTRRAYEIIDQELEPFLSGDCNIVLMSDHGCTEINTVFYINRWLEAEGYLATEESLSSRLHEIGVTQERVAEVVRKLGLEKHVRPLVPRQVIERFPSDEGVVRKEKLKMVDWENTTAIGSGQGLIYTVSNTEAERQSILESLEADLTDVTGVDGRPIAKQVHRREDLYHGDQVRKAPDLIFDQRPGVHTSEAMGTGDVVARPDDWKAENVPEGMVLFYGDDIKACEIGEIRITDIAPTILHWMGLEVPNDMDGEVVTEAFAPGSAPSEREINVRDSLPEIGTVGSELDASVEDRLERIGYLE